MTIGVGRAGRAGRAARSAGRACCCSSDVGVVAPIRRPIAHGAGGACCRRLRVGVVAPIPRAIAPGGAPSSPPGARIRLVDLGRIAWVCTVLACLVTVAILFVDGYYGYAEVTLAVAVAAGINLV